MLDVRFKMLDVRFKMLDLIPHLIQSSILQC
jgi:hypothetical protein